MREFRRRIFHVSSRPLHAEKIARAGKRLGLGLYIAAEIARAPDGSLKAESEGGRTRFSFRMPHASLEDTSGQRHGAKTR